MTATFDIFKCCMSQMFPRVGLTKLFRLNFKSFQLEASTLSKRLRRRELCGDPKNLLSLRLGQERFVYPRKEFNKQLRHNHFLFILQNATLPKNFNYLSKSPVNNNITDDGNDSLIKCKIKMVIRLIST